MQVSRATQVAVPSQQPAPVVRTGTVVGAFSLLLAGVVATRLWARWTRKQSESAEPMGLAGVIMRSPEPGVRSLHLPAGNVSAPKSACACGRNRCS